MDDAMDAIPSMDQCLDENKKNAGKEKEQSDDDSDSCLENTESNYCVTSFSILVWSVGRNSP
eukprot:m.455428 g.455428  ORF g.455428 m.455428 type:complete len:62 (+) comp20868_c0_seq1:97-282(+)